MFDKTTVSITLPTIPRQVAEAIERLRDPDGGHVFSNAEITAVASRTGGALHNDTITLQTIPFDTLLSALVNGYTVEKSAEELEREAHDRIREDYDYHYAWRRTDSYHAGRADGIIHTLDTLGIKIEGVNV